MPRVAKFAQAGNFNLALATDLLTDAQSALGLTIRDDVVKNMENMTRVSDVLVKANTLSNATVQQFSESLTNKAGAAMKMLNMDIEEGVAMLAAWADQGVKGSEAGNYLNIVLRDLQRATIENEEVFNKFNISVFDSSGNVRNMADVIGDLETALDGMSDKEKRATLMMLGFQDRSISAMMSLLGTSDSIRQYEKDLRSAAGYTDEVAKKQMESFTAQMKQLKNELINVGISIYEVLKPKLESLIEWIRKGTDWFNSLTDGSKKLIVSLGIFAAAIGPVLIGLGSITRAVVTLRTAMLSLAVATKLAYGELALIGAVIVQLGLQVYTTYDAVKKFKEGLQDWKEILISLIPFFGLGIYALRRATEGTEELTEATEEQTQKFETAEEAIETFTNQNLELGFAEGKAKEGAIEQAKAMGYLEDETEDTTEAIEDQTEAVDDLINSLFKLFNLHQSVTETGWKYREEVEKLTKMIKEGTASEEEMQKQLFNTQDAREDHIVSIFEELKAEDLSIERQKELRILLAGVADDAIKSGEITKKEFWEIAESFGFTAETIREDIYGVINPSYQEMYRQGQIISDQVIEPEIKVDTGPAMTALAGLKELLSQIKSKSITITTSYAYGTVKPYSMGGIVGYAGGGVVGNDGARQPILSAAYGMVTPQTGREIPIMAHEYEIIANTSQQRNLAEWIMGKANTRPNTTISKNEVILHIPLSLDGKVLYEVWEKYDLREGARRI